MKIMIVGAGGVGGFIAAKLCKKYPDITVVARGSHLDAMQKEGITLIDGGESINVKPSLVTSSPKEEQDVIFVCVKGYGLLGALETIRPCVGKNTIIIPLLNGVNIHKTISSVLGDGIAASGSIYVYSRIVSPGVIEKTGSVLRLVVGLPGITAQDAPKALKDLCNMLNDCGVNTELSDDIIKENWSKWAMFIANGQPNAYYGVSVGAILEDPEKLAFCKKLYKELMEVAKAEGIALDDDFEGNILAIMKKLPYESMSSLSRDILTPGNKTELSLFAGELCKIADAHGIDVPANKSMLNKFIDRL